MPNTLLDAWYYNACQQGRGVLAKILWYLTAILSTSYLLLWELNGFQHCIFFPQTAELKSLIWPLIFSPRSRSDAVCINKDYNFLFSGNKCLGRQEYCMCLHTSVKIVKTEQIQVHAGKERNGNQVVSEQKVLFTNVNSLYKPPSILIAKVWPMSF